MKQAAARPAVPATDDERKPAMTTLPRSPAAPGGDADRPDTHACGSHAIAAAKRA